MQQFNTLSGLAEYIQRDLVEEIAVQSLDLREIEQEVLATRFSKSLFLGCTLSDNLLHHLLPDNFVFPVLNVPFNSYPSSLYNK